MAILYISVWRGHTVYCCVEVPPWPYSILLCGGATMAILYIAVWRCHHGHTLYCCVEVYIAVWRGVKFLYCIILWAGLGCQIPLWLFVFVCMHVDVYELGTLGCVGRVG